MSGGAAPAFFWDELCFWHGGGQYAAMMPVRGHVQPGAGLPENPETKRRLKNLIEVTGLIRAFDLSGADPATEAELRRVHGAAYLAEFRRLSAADGGELGPRAPFLPGGYEIACRSAGLARAALCAVLEGRHQAAYALSRPPGHHCLPDAPMGFCLLANIAVAVEAALDAGLAGRVAVLDWDVHHGNGTEAIFYDRPEVLTISLHQERNFPLDRGAAEDTGSGAGVGANVNLPLPPGTGHAGYMEAFDRIVAPRISAFRPDVLMVACGYDAAALDPLGRMLLHSESFAGLTGRAMTLAEDLCGGRLVMVHEGGYSETYVPFCGHAALQRLARSPVAAEDPMLETWKARQPGPTFDRFLSGWIGELAEFHGV
jgi:acetoin utilization deacetylase AcuC-like enzyme